MAQYFLSKKEFDKQEAELTEALSGNYCRCISHYQVIRTVMAFVEKIREERA